MKTFYTIMFWACIVLAIAACAMAIYNFTHDETLWGIIQAQNVIMHIASTAIFYILKED